MEDRRWRALVQLLVGIGLTSLFFYMMAPFVVATLLGAIIAIICYPLFSALTRKLPRALSALIVTLGVTIGVLIPIGLALYSIVYNLIRHISSLPFLKDGPPLEHFGDIPWATPAINFVSQYFPVDQEWIQVQALELIKNIVQKLSNILTSSIAQAPGFLLAVIVIILSVYFFLVDGKRFLDYLKQLSPWSPEKTVKLYNIFEGSCRGVVVGLFLGAFVQGLLIAIFFGLTKLPNPLLCGMIGIACGMVPMVGTGPLWIGAVIYLLFIKHSIFLGCLMIVGGVLITLSDNVIRSWILSGTSQMHPFLALISVFGAVNLMGPPGIFFGPIIAAVFLAFITMMSPASPKLP